MGTTGFPLFKAFLQARVVNIHSGGAVIAPWELLPGYSEEEWIEAAMALNTVPAIQKRKKAEQQYFEKFRREHKDYARIHYRTKVN